MSDILREKLVCKICGNEQYDNLYIAKEMMFGFRDEFKYFECSGCGCLQIKDLPENISKYYPEVYYSFKALPAAREDTTGNFLGGYLRGARTRYFMYQKDLAGRLVLALKPIGKPFSGYLEWLKKCHADLNSKILDVGCGTGSLLLHLRWFGFRDLSGIDPYIPEDISYKNGIQIQKKGLDAVKTKFDVLMFHHSFEHIQEPLEIFENISKLLTDKGCALIRIPTVSSYAWKNYGVNWVQLDAPRHFFLHSLKSIELLAVKAGLKIKEIVFDSTEFQFLGSQQYEQGISLLSGRSYYVNPKAALFNTEQIDFFRSEAARLNKERQGDQICVYLVKK